jgi:type I restriction enzyme S subunit
MTDHGPEARAIHVGRAAASAPNRELEKPRKRRYKPYAAYKNTGIEWLGTIPASWEILRLSEVATVLNGYPFDSEFFVRSEGTPLVRIRDLNSVETEVNFIGPVIQSASIDHGDVIVGMDGDFKVARWRGQRALLNQRMCCLRARGGFDAGFIAYLIPFPLEVINDLTYSTTVKHLSSVDVRKIQLGAPDREEQRAIARFLDRETTKIDTLVAKEELLVDLLQEKRLAFITQTVTKGLDSKAITRDSGFQWLGAIPAHWEVKPLKAVSDLQTGLTLGKRYEGGSLTCRPYLRVANVQDGYLALHDIAEIELPSQDAARYELRKGDVLMTEGGDFDKLGRGYVWEGPIAGCLHQNHIFAVRPRRHLLRSYFLAHVMSSGYGRAYFTATSKQSTNLASTNSTKVRNLPVPLPSLTEQDEILLSISQGTERTDALIAEVRQAIDRLKELRTALISAAVTGKIDVREEVA